MWWTFSNEDDWNDCDFIWSPWKNDQIINSMKSFNLNCYDNEYFITNHSEKIVNSRFKYINNESKEERHKESTMRVRNDSTNAKAKKRVYNHLEGISNISNKKDMFINLREYYKNIQEDLFQSIPETYHILNSQDAELQRFITRFEENPNLNIWIIKPGENSNRGNGIIITDKLKVIISYISEFESNHTFIIQKYIENPLLINKRKFDIRCFTLLTSINGNLKGYFYNEGYIRTSSNDFSLVNLENKFIHLTNDAVQKLSNNYGKYEDGNKVKFNSFHFTIFKNL